MLSAAPPTHCFGARKRPRAPCLERKEKGGEREDTGSPVEHKVVEALHCQILRLSGVEPTAKAPKKDGAGPVPSTASEVTNRGVLDKPELGDTANGAADGRLKVRGLAFPPP